jgi:hypothetical protein
LAEKIASACSYYYWGNVPAFDCLNLVETEGTTYGSALKVLILGVGDLRNVALTCVWYHEQQKTRFQFNITVYSLNINHITVLHSRKPKIRMLNVSCCFPVCPLTNISKYVMSAHILWVLHHPPPSL